MHPIMHICNILTTKEIVYNFCIKRQFFFFLLCDFVFFFKSQQSANSMGCAIKIIRDKTSPISLLLNGSFIFLKTVLTFHNHLFLK